MSRLREEQEDLIFRRLKRVHWPFMTLITVITLIGVAMLYSAAKGNFDPWASRQLMRFLIAIPLMLTVAVIHISFWFRYAYVLFAVGVVLLVVVHLVGHIGMGAQRWINIGGFTFQPSELMKSFLALALARYFHSVHPNVMKQLPTLIVPALLIMLPVGLILKQPNLGTATITLAGGAAIMFYAGVGWKKFVVVGIVALSLMPVGWHFLHDYQKARVNTFINPESDPLGKGYNILQSKIAIGSGGIFGKGFLKGSQSQLSFLPEKQTDFIFTMVAEEFGLVGGIVVIGLYVLLLFMGMVIALECESFFGKLVALGIMSFTFLHAFINIAMVMGLLPVVGVPLPLLSYGGSSMISTLVGMGFILNAHVHRDAELSR